MPDRKQGVQPASERLFESGETLEDIEAVDSGKFRQAMGYFPTGVTVITTAYEDSPIGITANAVSSVSLEPTLLLVCVSTKLFTHEAVEATGRFAVNVLGENQEWLARHFATKNPDKFTDVRHHWACGVPVLEDAIAHFVCETHERYPGGDHSVFVGRVLQCGHVAGRQPLLFFGSRFGRIEHPETQLHHTLSHCT